MLYAIACTFRLLEQDDPHHGIAICSNPDTVVTFIYSDGLPYTGKAIWNYSLHHHKPWAAIQASI